MLKSIPALATLALALVNAEQPNVLFLLLDDTGYGDVDMCHDGLTSEQCDIVPPGNTAKRESGYIRSPRIKQLAKEGTIMTNWYSPRAICTPSRAATLSGRDPVHFGGVGEMLRIYPSNPARGGYPHSERSVAEYMQENGYVTGYSGKWHIGLTNGSDHPYAYTPVNHGFDEVDQFIAGSNGEPCNACNMNVAGDENIYHMCTFSQILTFDEDKQGRIVEQPIRWENITSRLLTAPLAFLDRHASDEAPFFYIHAFAKNHVPWVPSRFFVSSIDGIWADTVGEVDWAVGVLVAKLKEIGKYDNTMIIFTSDNGPYKEFASTFQPQNCKFSGCTEGPEYSPGDGGVPIDDNCELVTDFNTVSTAGMFTGGKGNTFEGGLRMPTIISWPAAIPAGTINPIVSSSLDILPTAVAAAGGQLDTAITIDGNNILESLKSPNAWDSTPEGNFVYWCGVGINAVRIGAHKVIYFTQRFTASMKNDGNLTPEDRCDGGTCCDGSPGRLCTCIVGEKHEVPIVIDLVANPSEDFVHSLDPADAATMDIVTQADALRDARQAAVMESLDPDNTVGWKEATTSTKIFELLLQWPNNVQIDACILTGNFIPDLPIVSELGCGITAGDEVGCPFIPSQCQLPEYAPYEGCSIDNMESSCQARRPCCVDDEYEGPWEYENPVALTLANNKFQKCGCFKQAQGNSHFPEFLLESVCEWQQLDAADGASDVSGLMCSPGVCGTESGLPCTDENLKNYGLWNAPYPENPKKKPDCQGGADGCCALGGESCSGIVRACVASFDPFCEFEWDTQCIEEAKESCTLSC